MENCPPLVLEFRVIWWPVLNAFFLCLHHCLDTIWPGWISHSLWPSLFVLSPVKLSSTLYFPTILGSQTTCYTPPTLDLVHFNYNLNGFPALYNFLPYAELIFNMPFSHWTLNGDLSQRDNCHSHFIYQENCDFEFLIIIVLQGIHIAGGINSILGCFIPKLVCPAARSSTGHFNLSLIPVTWSPLKDCGLYIVQTCFSLRKLRLSYELRAVFAVRGNPCFHL
jgi:hypothetical protein